MSLLANSNAIEDAGYNIQRSLRFRSSASAYLNRTFGTPTNQAIWTWNGWVKRGTLGAGVSLFAAGSASTNDYSSLQFNTDNTLSCYANNGTVFELKTTQVFRDPSAFYMVTVAVDSTQATAANRVKLYVNGAQVTALSVATYPALNATSGFNTNAKIHAIGALYSGSYGQYFDGYLAEVNFIDGQALTPSSFGQTDPVTGVWTPKKYTGTYGTNGFYLPFSDNTSATTLAYDKSGNGNNWTPNNISTTAGATYDSMTDVPTLTSATAANYCVLNPLNTNGNVTVSAGNLDVVGTSTTDTSVGSTFAVSSGKWYCEATFTVGASHDFIGVGITTPQNSLSQVPGYYSDGYMVGFGTNNSTFYKVNNNSYVDASLNYSGAGAYVVQIALDMDNGKVWFGRNNTWISSGDPAAGTNATYSSISSSNPQMVKWWGDSSGPASINFGQRPFSYTPPTGFKALNTFNLPDPTIKKPNQYMDATLYTGDGTTGRLITNAAAFQPDLVWIKSRSNALNNNLYDSVRGAPLELCSNNTAADSSGDLTAFNTGGFTINQTAGYEINHSGYTYVGWQWKESATAGFDIVTYTGTGVARTVSHSLGVAPKFMIVKNRSAAPSSWAVYHGSYASASYYQFLDTTQAASANNVVWNGTAPTSSVFSVGTDVVVNANTNNYVAYLFAEIAGFSKFGSYTGNSSADGSFVYCGFRPRYILIKSSNAAWDWMIYDTAINPYNLSEYRLYANLSSAQAGPGGADVMDILSNGFKLRGNSGEVNTTGNTYIYAAFAENPFKYSNAR